MAYETRLGVVAAAASWRATMKGICLFLLLVTVAFLGGGAAELGYINSWAVEVSGGARIAEELARKHGFINEGQVSSLMFFRLK